MPVPSGVAVIGHKNCILPTLSKRCVKSIISIYPDKNLPGTQISQRLQLSSKEQIFGTFEQAVPLLQRTKHTFYAIILRCED